MDLSFYLILGISAFFGVAFAISTKGIFYHTPDTDNELMAYAAAQSHKWKWFSDVHKYSASTRKCSMKEWTIILLSIFQKIFRSKTTDWPYTAMTGLSISFSTLLIYAITANYFNEVTGLLIALLYIISFWPWQVSLYGGHANMANLFFLLSAYSIQISFGVSIFPLILITVGGVFLGFCLFSSPSSHKYLIGIFAALFFNSYRNFFESNNISEIIHTLPINHLVLMDVIILAIFLLATTLVLFTYKWIVKKIYNQKAPKFLNKLMSGRENFSLEHYIDNAHKKIKTLLFWEFWLLLSFLLAINLIPLSTLLAFAAGFVFVFFAINLPNTKENVVEYFACMLEHKKKTHFKSYVEYFAKRGISVQRNTRGAGLSWVPKLLWKFAPFHMALFIVMFAIGEYQSIATRNTSESVLIIIISLVALSPIIWAELTKAPQASRLYSPSLITSLLLPAYILSGAVWTVYTLLLPLGILVLIFAWNFWRFTDDIYPARMTIRSLMKVVRKHNINEIYTYSTSHNAAFIYAVPGIGKQEYLPRQDIVPPFKINYIRRLDEVKDGWIAIPGTSGKSLTAAGLSEPDQDYISDPLLNHLIETRRIEKIAEAKFKTYGTSTIWIHEDDITSYRSLHLKDIGPKDLYRGYAWLIHSSKLKGVIKQ